MCILLAVAPRAGASPAPLTEAHRAHAAALVEAHEARSDRYLLYDAAALEELREGVEGDARLAELAEQLRARSAALLGLPPPRYEKIGIRLLQQSRAVLARVLHGTLLYHLDGDTATGRACVETLLVAADFPDWNPSHFLDTAEMALAFAIGLDGLQGVYTPEEGERLRQALLTKGLHAGLAALEEPQFWTTLDYGTNNWAVVCYTGLVAASLVLADEAPEAAHRLIAHARERIPAALAEYAPAGVFKEGLSYWDYATEYALIYHLLLEPLAGSAEAVFPEAFRASILPRLHGVSPAGRFFNFADSSAIDDGSPAFLWFTPWAEGFDLKERALGHARRQLPRLLEGGAKERLFPLNLLFWHRAALYDAASPAPPRVAWFPGPVSLAAARGSWADPEAFYVAAKGGDNRVSHGQHDMGTFVYERWGQLWAMDLGRENYAVEDYFDSAPRGRRWSYLRATAAGHNVVTLGGRDQHHNAVASVVGAEVGEDTLKVIWDLSEGYYGQALRVLRGLEVDPRGQVLLQDEIHLDDWAASIEWNLYTPARVTIEGRRVALSQGEHTLYLHALSPSWARWSVDSVEEPAPEAYPTEGLSHLRLRLSEAAPGVQRLAVWISPEPEGPPAALSLRLRAWFE